ncbi:MAG: HIT domain-containing protein [Dehalococcoidia bacterium]|nr:MAG: HIT domain-containing protein [Dehalococcoidia bacterium]
MEYLWAPWRIEYVKKARDEKKGGCILCSKTTKKNDSTNLILYRGQYCFIMMNSYPYNSGHLMIAPYRHVANLEDLNNEERDENFALVSRSVAIEKRVLKADGFNIGINLGRIAGAGIDKHIHIHVVPRWLGDTNFMPVVADIKVVNEAIKDTYNRLVDEFSSKAESRLGRS